MIRPDQITEFVGTVNRCPAWIITWNNNSGNKLYSSDSLLEDGELNTAQDLDRSMEHLQECINRLSPGLYKIRCWRRENYDRKGGNTEIFKVEGEAPVVSGHQSGVFGSANIFGVSPQNYIQDQINAALAAKELTALKEENAMLRAEVEDPGGNKTVIAGFMEKIMDTPGIEKVFAGITSAIVNKLSGTPATRMAGPPVDTAEAADETHYTDLENEMDEQQEQYAETLLRLRAVIPNLLEVLNKLADKAEADPDGFRKKIKMLDMFL